MRLCYADRKSYKAHSVGKSIGEFVNMFGKTADKSGEKSGLVVFVEMMFKRCDLDLICI